MANKIIILGLLYYIFTFINILIEKKNKITYSILVAQLRNLLRRTQIYIISSSQIKKLIKLWLML